VEPEAKEGRGTEAKEGGVSAVSEGSQFEVEHCEESSPAPEGWNKLGEG